MALLHVDSLHAGYGDLPVLHDISFTVAEGEVVTIVGPNGAGKTTLLKSVMGLIPPTQGAVNFDGSSHVNVAPHEVPELGIVMVPEGRHLFPFMTVDENLQVGAFNKRARGEAVSTLTEVFELFPVLKERRNQLAGSLSGGEQQMCALGRALMAKPRLLILDEPSLGLAPVMVERIFEFIAGLAKSGMTLVLVEQNVHDALQMADRGYVLERGRMVMTGTGAELLDDPQLQQAYLGI